ncbi:MAG: PKD domain-containing protein [Bacteroidetes bacterium]|nr:PKD domain-containing protein [Bacteroidota bacterium]
MKRIYYLVIAEIFVAITLLPVYSFAQKIAAGDVHSMKLCSDGTVMAWGYNGSGQLGDGTTTNSNIPVQVSGLTGITSIETGFQQSLALKNNGTVWAWGWNAYGQLGDGTTTDRTTPVQVIGLTGISFIASAVAPAVAGGGYHSMALKNDGTVWAWGYNGDGALGDGTNTDRLTPVQVSGLTGIIAISTEAYHSLALKNDGTVWAWGRNTYGALGDGTTTNSNIPVQVSGLTGVTSVKGGGYFSLALQTDGTVWAWGYNLEGQLGDGTAINRTTPVQVSGLTGVAAVNGGDYHSLALKNDGTIWTWGRNSNGQLGDGTTTNRTTPVQVSGLTGIAAIAAGWLHSAALKNDGTMWAWGWNFYGQLGDGTTTDRTTPVQVIGLCTPTGSSCANAVDLGSSDTCANNITMSDSVMWFRFVADSQFVKISITLSVSSHIQKAFLYNDCVSSFQIASDYIIFTTDNILELFGEGLAIGNTYYIKLESFSTNFSVVSICTQNLPNSSIKANSACDNWTQKANFGASVRSYAVGFSIGNKGYIGTGSLWSTLTYYNDFWEWDQVTDTWTQKANFGGTGRLAAVGFSIGNKGYIGTGWDASTSFNNDFWEYDPSTNTWTQKANFGGDGRFKAVGFSIGNKGYIGTGAGQLAIKNDFWEYDPSTNTWTQKANFGGTARWASVGFSIGAKGYIGTGTPHNTYPTAPGYDDFWEYNPSTNVWTQKANFGGGNRQGAIGFSIPVCNKGYIGAGYNDNIYTNDFWEYDPSINVWIQKANFGGVPRLDASGFSIGNKGYIGTGWGYSGSKNDFWEYNGGCFTIGITSSNASCAGFCDGTATASVTSGGTAPFTFSWNTVPVQTGPTVIGLCAGSSYIVTVTDAAGCTKTANTTIGSNNLPPVVNFNFSPLAVNLCVTSPVSFTFTGSLATGWQWNFGDPASGANNISSQKNPSHTYSSPGFYPVILTATNACGTTSIQQVIYIGPDCCANTTNTNYTPGFTTTVTYTSNTVWASNLVIAAPVIVKAPATLTVKPGVIIQFGPMGKIIIENGSTSINGAQLVLQTNSKLTSIPCPVMWQGVEVWGVPTNNSSNSLGQGKITMNAGATIENAHIGVLLGKTRICFPFQNTLCKKSPWDITRSGGIIIANQSVFNKNAESVHFLPYNKLNSSLIKQCSFTGGTLIDPRYNYSISNPFYPNVNNPYYAPANSIGRTPWFGYLWGVKNVKFWDNTFNTAGDGILLYDAQSEIKKNIPGNGNSFTNLVFCIRGFYYNSGFFGNLIQSNTFNDIIGAAVEMHAGKYDQIKRNKFHDPSNFSSQAMNLYALTMAAASNYKVLDNDFFRWQVGINADHSWQGGGSLIGWEQTGNIFTECQTSINLNQNNSKLQIRCNKFNNPVSANYLINWSNSINSLLANQGYLPVLSAYDPAGNIFDLGASIPKKQIGSVTNSFIYYRHINSTVPGCGLCIEPDVTNSPALISVSPQPFTHTQTSCNDPCSGNPACRIAQLSNLSNRISSLQLEFTNVFANLDKGQTAQLLSAISGNTSDGNLKNMLLNNSFLSDQVLIAFINRKNTAHGIFKEVIIPNSPVSDDVRPALLAKLASMPSGISKQIKDAQGSQAFRTLTAISRELASSDNQRQLALNDLVSYYVQADSANTAITLLEAEHTLDADQTLVATYLNEGMLTEAETKLNSMTASIPEEQAFIDLHRMLLELEMDSLSVFDMDSAQEQLVRNIAGMSASLARANACSILQLVFNETCPSSFREQGISSSAEAVHNVVESDSYLGENYPNPFSNLTIIPYNLPGNSGGYIKIYDVKGTLLNTYLLKEGFNFIEVKTENWASGVYYYSMEMDGIRVQNKKMVLINNK